jgi:benzodiazapine receptor
MAVAAIGGTITDLGPWYRGLVKPPGQPPDAAFLNLFGSLLFFRLHRPDWALLEVVGFWLSIVLLIVFLARLSRIASALMAPYLVWVTVAAALNYEVVHLNAPFGPT